GRSRDARVRAARATSWTTQTTQLAVCGRARVWRFCRKLLRGADTMSRAMKTRVVWCGLALGGLAVAAVTSAQGRCMTTFGSPACNTADIPTVFAPTGWKTVALDHVTF